MDHPEASAIPQFVQQSRPAPQQAPACGPPHEWRVFLRALADEIDAQGGEQARDDLLRAVGRRMAMLKPLPSVATLEALQMEMNEVLHSLGWGSTSLAHETNEQSLTIVHSGL